MNIIVSYDDERHKQINPMTAENIPIRIKTRINKMPEQDITFNKSGTAVLNCGELKTEKPNIIRFRIVSFDEEENVKTARKSNIFRLIGFVLMAIFLPFAFMRFENGPNRRYNKIKFNVLPEKDCILSVSQFKWKFNYVEKLSAPQSVDDVFSLNEEIPTPTAEQRI